MVDIFFLRFMVDIFFLRFMVDIFFLRFMVDPNTKKRPPFQAAL